MKLIKKKNQNNKIWIVITQDNAFNHFIFLFQNKMIIFFFFKFGVERYNRQRKINYTTFLLEKFMLLPLLEG